jgi:YD repeat-containing protein
MSRLTFGIIFVFSLLFLTSARPCAAQNGNPCEAITTWWFPDPLPLGWYYLGSYPGTYVYYIATKTNTCGPPCHCKCEGGACGSPISLATGNTFIEEADFKLPGLGGGLELTRTWNSVWPPNVTTFTPGMFGPLWRSTYEEGIFMGTDNYLRYVKGDGEVWVFGEGQQGVLTFASPKNVTGVLVDIGTTVVLTFQNGEQRQFSPTTGQLTAIIDRSGNTTQLAYDSLNRLVTVTSPASQHVYFNYQSGSSYLVTSVTSDFGVTFSYSYNSVGLLSQVTRPDQTTISYTYNAQSQLTQVTDSNGKVLESHTYDSTGRGLTSSQANGVNTVSVTYPLYQQ